MNTNQNTKRIIIFLAFAFGIPWIAALVIFLSGMSGKNPLQAGTIANYIFIFTPWLANIIARLLTKEEWKNLMLRPNFKRSWRFYLASWFLPLAVTIVGMTAFYLIYPNLFDKNLTNMAKMVESSPSASGLNPWLILLSTTLSLVAVSTPINGLASIGEEFGWRAYLLPKLLSAFSQNSSVESTGTENLGQENTSRFSAPHKAALLTGLIHGIWHLPLMLLTMGSVPGMTFLTPLVYLVMTCSLSVFLSWVTIRSNSVWTASLGHGAGNAAAALPGFLLNGSPVPLMGPDATGLLGGIGYSILALILLFSRKAFLKEDQNKGQ
jgi:membrane protease YdiL (CAAX protease family)